jgi:hypothetical protein
VKVSWREGKKGKRLEVKKVKRREVAVLYYEKKKEILQSRYWDGSEFFIQRPTKLD